MKVTAIQRQRSSTVEWPPRISHYPGSAVFHGGKPFFVPGISNCWEARHAVAVRLCRLGKSIDEKFASRYYDAIAPVLMFVPADIERQPGMDGMISAIDNTVAIGPWQPLPDNTDDTCTLSTPCGDLTFTLSDSGIDNVISTISRFMTIQMGDALIPFVMPAAIPVKPDVSISLALNAGPTFTVRTK